MLVIYFFSSRPTVSLSSSLTNSFFIYKSFHLIEYTFLSILVFYAIKNYKYTVMVVYLYAMSDELHQTYIPGRTGCIRDTLIDLIGITIGIILITQIKKIKFLSAFFR